MNKEDNIYFAGLMEDYLNIPSFLCETIEKDLEQKNYKSVIEYIIQRKRELKSIGKDKDILIKEYVEQLKQQLEKYTKTYKTKEKMQELDKEDLINMLCASWSRENEKTRQLEVSEQKRLKAIEYINKYSDKGYNFGWILQDGELDKLLEILGD